MTDTTPQNQGTKPQLDGNLAASPREKLMIIDNSPGMLKRECQRYSKDFKVIPVLSGVKEGTSFDLNGKTVQSECFSTRAEFESILKRTNPDGLLVNWMGASMSDSPHHESYTPGDGRYIIDAAQEIIPNLRCVLHSTSDQAMQAAIIKDNQKTAFGFDERGAPAIALYFKGELLGKADKKGREL